MYLQAGLRRWAGESTRLQYASSSRANRTRLAWRLDRRGDSDQGESDASVHQLGRFRRLVTEVSMGSAVLDRFDR